jgi:hypothetical protein
VLKKRESVVKRFDPNQNKERKCYKALKPLNRKNIEYVYVLIETKDCYLIKTNCIVCTCVGNIWIYFDGTIKR